MFENIAKLLLNDTLKHKQKEFLVVDPMCVTILSFFWCISISRKYGSFHPFLEQCKTGCHDKAFAHALDDPTWQKGKMLTIILKIILIKPMIKNFYLIAQNSYAVLIILCSKSNAHSQITAHLQHTSLTVNKESNIQSTTPLQADSKAQQFHTWYCYLHISPSCKSPSSSGQDELQGLCGVRRNAVEPLSCANIISPESSSTCTK
jgi:hypothetical protein